MNLGLCRNLSLLAYLVVTGGVLPCVGLFARACEDYTDLPLSQLLMTLVLPLLGQLVSVWATLSSAGCLFRGGLFSVATLGLCGCSILSLATIHDLVFIAEQFVVFVLIPMGLTIVGCFGLRWTGIRLRRTIPRGSNPCGCPVEIREILWWTVISAVAVNIAIQYPLHRMQGWTRQVSGPSGPGMMLVEPTRVSLEIETTKVLFWPFITLSAGRALLGVRRKGSAVIAACLLVLSAGVVLVVMETLLAGQSQRAGVDRMATGLLAVFICGIVAAHFIVIRCAGFCLTRLRKGRLRKGDAARGAHF